MSMGWRRQGQVSGLAGQREAYLFVGVIFCVGRRFGGSSNWGEQGALRLFRFEGSSSSLFFIEGYHICRSWVIFIVFVESINLF
jgi:hypothetical protein